MNSNPILALVLGFKNYANFKGRTGRADFWFWVLSTVILSGIANFIDSLLTPRNAQEPSLTIPYVAGALSLVLWIPSMAIAVRRIRDAGKSPWLYLLNFVPGIAVVITVAVFINEMAAFLESYGQDVWSGGFAAGLGAILGALASIFMMLGMADAANPDVASLLSELGAALSGTMIAGLVTVLVSLSAGIWLLVLYVSPSKGAPVAVETEE